VVYSNGELIVVYCGVFRMNRWAEWC